jgi:hypothetical protein
MPASWNQEVNPDSFCCMMKSKRRVYQLAIKIGGYDAAWRLERNEGSHDGLKYRLTGSLNVERVLLDVVLCHKVDDLLSSGDSHLIFFPRNAGDEQVGHGCKVECGGGLAGKEPG